MVRISSTLAIGIAGVFLASALRAQVRQDKLYIDNDNGTFTVLTGSGSASSFQFPAGTGTILTSLTGLSNPMTALGDMIYGGVLGVTTRLIGNTTSTKKFLTSTGALGFATIPAWSTIAPTDLPVATSIAVGAVEPDGSTITVNGSGVISASSSISGLTKYAPVYAASTTSVASTTSAMSNGQLLVGSSGAAPVPATLGTSNGVTTSTGAGTLSIGLGAITPTSINLGTGVLNTVGNITIDGSAARTITVAAPAATGDGESLTLTGAAATTTGSGGSIGITGGGANGSGVRNGGSITLTPGAGSGTGTIGSIVLAGPVSANGSVGNSTQVLTSQGAGMVPKWTTVSGGQTVVVPTTDNNGSETIPISEFTSSSISQTKTGSGITWTTPSASAITASVGTVAGTSWFLTISNEGTQAMTFAAGTGVSFANVTTTWKSGDVRLFYIYVTGSSAVTIVELE